MKGKSASSDLEKLDDSVRRMVILGLTAGAFTFGSGMVAQAYSMFTRSNHEENIAVRPNNNLEKRIENYIKRLRMRGILSLDESISCSVYDLTSERNVVAIDEDLPRMSASMVKPLVALAYFHEVGEGRLAYNWKDRENLRSMIVDSSNIATNRIFDRIGGPEKVQEILQGNYGNILQQTKIVEDIPVDGRTYKNIASAQDYSEFLLSLWNNKLPYSNDLKSLLRANKISYFTGGRVFPKYGPVLNKTGTTARLIGEMAIIVAKDRLGKQFPYILVSIIENEKRTNWSSKKSILRGISNITYFDMKRTHNLV